jgi:hypothetical protein
VEEALVSFCRFVSGRMDARNHPRIFHEVPWTVGSRGGARRLR